MPQISGIRYSGKELSNQDGRDEQGKPNELDNSDRQEQPLTQELTQRTHRLRSHG